MEDSRNLNAFPEDVGSTVLRKLNTLRHNPEYRHFNAINGVVNFAQIQDIAHVYHGHLGAPSLGVKRPGREADLSPPTSAEVKNAWSYTSTPPIRLHGVVLSSAQRKFYLYLLPWTPGNLILLSLLSVVPQIYRHMHRCSLVDTPVHEDFSTEGKRPYQA
jgi:hypothetical protein